MVKRFDTNYPKNVSGKLGISVLKIIYTFQVYIHVFILKLIYKYLKVILF